MLRVTNNNLLDVIMLNVVMLSVVAPFRKLSEKNKN
jgi:hypothetical protein